MKNDEGVGWGISCILICTLLGFIFFAMAAMLATFGT